MSEELLYCGAASTQGIVRYHECVLVPGKGQHPATEQHINFHNAEAEVQTEPVIFCSMLIKQYSRIEIRYVVQVLYKINAQF